MINIPIYKNENIYKECFFKIEDDFNEINSPLLKAIVAFNNMDKSNEQKIRFCLIDEKFLIYRKENNFKDISIALKTYMKQMTDNDAKKLWKESSFARGEQLLLYPFLIINEKIPQKTNIFLEKESLKNFRNKTINSLNITKEDIYVPGYVSSFNTIIEKEGMLEGLGEAYIYDKQKISFEIMNEQINDTNSNIFPFCIPFFIRKELNYKMSLNDFCDFYNNESITKSKAIEISKNLNDLFNLDESFQIFAIIDDFIITDELQEIYEEINILINKIIKKKKNIFDIFKHKK